MCMDEAQKNLVKKRYFKANGGRYVLRIKFQYGISVKLT